MSIVRSRSGPGLATTTGAAGGGDWRLVKSAIRARKSSMIAPIAQGAHAGASAIWAGVAVGTAVAAGAGFPPGETAVATAAVATAVGVAGGPATWTWRARSVVPPVESVTRRATRCRPADSAAVS